MLAVRFGLAGALLYGWSAWRGDLRRTRPGRREWTSAAIVGGLLLFVDTGGIAWAEQRVASGLTALLVASVPLFTALLDRDVLRRRGSRSAPCPGSPPACSESCCSSARARTSSGPAPRSSSAPRSPGRRVPRTRASRRSPRRRSVRIDADALRRCVPCSHRSGDGRGSAASTRLRSRPARLPRSPISSSSARSSPSPRMARPPRSGAPSVLVSTYAYVNPAVAVLLGWAFAGEAISGRELAAGAVILASVAMLVLARERHQDAEPLPETLLVTCGARRPSGANSRRCPGWPTCRGWPPGVAPVAALRWRDDHLRPPHASDSLR